jgi:hypothetical protein
MLEDDMTQRRADFFKQIQLENKRLALEKKKREENWRHEQARLDKREIIRENDEEHFDFMRRTAFTATASGSGPKD